MTSSPSDRADIGAGVLDDADEFVPNRAAARRGGHRVVRVEVGSAYAGADHADDRVGWLLDNGIGNVDDTDVACSVDERCSHVASFACLGQ